MSFFEWAIIAFIVLSILYHVWKGGSRNPESTGALGQKFTGLSSAVDRLGNRVGHVEQKVDRLEEEAATIENIAELEKRIEEKFNTVAAQLEGQLALSQRTNHSVDRIERILIERSLDK